MDNKGPTTNSLPLAGGSNFFEADEESEPQAHNSDYFSSGEPITMEPTVSEPGEPLVFEDVEDAEGPQSSFDNIIPLDNLKHGLAVMSEMVEKTANKVQEKATEVLQSEQFQHAKKRTADVLSPAWEKTCEAAAPVWETTKVTASKAAEKTREVAVPVWEQTKVTASMAAEKTSEGLNSAAQRMKPTMQQLGRQLSDATTSSWRFLSAAALNAADYTSKMAADVLGDEEGSAQQHGNVDNIPPTPGNEFNTKPMSL